MIRKKFRNRLQMRVVLLLSLMLVLIGASGSAEIYRWTSRSGQVHYSSSPPTYPVPGPIEVKYKDRWQPYTGRESFPNFTTGSTSRITYTTSFPEQSLPLESASQQTIVTYHKHQSMIIVDVTLNGALTRPFAVDTGATYTVISQKLADALRLRPAASTPRITLQTANGRIQVPLLTLDSLAIGDLESSHITAAIHQFDDDSIIEGLLGLNFLNRFQMTVDARARQLILTPIAHDCAAAREQVDLGQALRNNSEQEAAHYRKAIALCPDLIESYYFLGIVYIQQHDARRAIELHRQLVRRQPDDPEAYFRLGIAYLLERDVQQARRQFQKAVDLNSQHAQAREYLERLKNL
jgi:clan AA aspartic protease (TIGR02281 family)